MTRLKTALRFNALISLITGLIAICFAHWLSTVIGVLSPFMMQCFGALLISHAAALFILSAGQTARKWAWINVALIAPYPVVLVALIFLGFVLEGFGTFIAITDAVIVSVMAVWQVRLLQNTAPSK